jgi:hypothetical protein
MNSEIIKEKLGEKSIWNDPDLAEGFENYKNEHTSEITETNKPWRYDIDPEDLGLVELRVSPVFIHNGNAQSCRMTKIPIFRNTDLNKNFLEIKPKKLKKELASYIKENFTHINIVVEHRQSAVMQDRVIDMIHYMVHGVKIDHNGNN